MASGLVRFDPIGSKIRWDSKPVKAELDATNRANRDAARGVPSHDAHHCPFIDDVRQAVDDVAKEARRLVEDHLSGIVAQRQAVPVTKASMLQERTSALAAMTTAVNNAINKTSTLAQRAVGAQREYTNFTIEHGLVGKVADHKNTRVWWFIFCSAVLEVLVNGWTLGTAHPDGVVGVVPEVVLFTAINMVLGLLAGAAMRRTNYRPKRSFRCVRAWMGVSSCVILVLVVSFVFGHYRDALVGLQNSAAGDYESYIRLWATLFQTALGTAFSDNWIPQTMQTVVLIVAGWLISGFVAIEWYRSDDRYPEFGRTTRKKDQAEREYAEMVASVKRDVDELSAQASAKFAALEATVVAAAQLPNTVTSCRDSYTDLVEELNSFGKSQMEAYRVASRQLRPWPKELEKAFGAPPVSKVLATAPSIDGGLSIDDAQVEEVTDLRRRCDRAVNQAREQFSEDVFAPVPTLNPQHQDHDRFANPVAVAREIAKRARDLP